MSRIPFFKPWGFGGCLWRFIVYLLGIILISLLLAFLIKGCDDTKKAFEEFIDNPEQLIKPIIPSEESPYGPDDPYRDYP